MSECAGSQTVVLGSTIHMRKHCETLALKYSGSPFLDLPPLLGA